MSVALGSEMLLWGVNLLWGENLLWGGRSCSGAANIALGRICSGELVYSGG